MEKIKKWNSEKYQDRCDFVYHYGKEVLGWLDPQPGEYILDLGCGTGQLADEIANHGCRVIGMDRSEEMINKAKYNYPYLNFQVGNAVNFKLKNPVDAVFSNAVLHWVTDPKNALISIYQSLTPGGRFVAEFGGAGNVQNMLKALSNTYTSHGLKFPNIRSLWYFPTIGQYAGLLEETGFTINKIHYIDRPTELKDRENGVVEWFEMFGDYLLGGIPERLKQEILKETQESLRKTHYIEGKWMADYKRIRVHATKP